LDSPYNGKLEGKRKTSERSSQLLPLSKLPTRAAGGWFFFPSLSEGKNHPLPILGDRFSRQLGLFIRGD